MADALPTTLALVDGGMICGWRRSTPSLEQLDHALRHLREAHPGLAVAVVGDPALKHSLPPAEQALLENGIAARSIVLAPAGTIGGFSRFLARVVEQAERRGKAPVVITDQSVDGARLGRARLEGDRWTFELGEVHIPEEAAAAAHAGPPVASFGREAVAQPATRGDRGGRATGRRRAKRVPRSGRTVRPSGHDRLLDAMAAVLAEADPDGRLVDRMADPEAVGRAAARAMLRAMT